VIGQIAVVTRNEGMDDIHTGGGEGGWHVRSQFQLKNKGKDDLHPRGGNMSDYSPNYKMRVKRRTSWR
jgi:hypothetical protein